MLDFRYLFLRYNKDLAPNLKILNKQLWFLLHMPMMILVPILAIIAFFIILADLDWQWVENTEQTRQNYAHSIIGIFAIILSIIQVVIALVRPKPDAKYRHIFNNIHSFNGILTFLLSSEFLFSKY